MRISDWSSDVCSSDLIVAGDETHHLLRLGFGRDGNVKLEEDDRRILAYGRRRRRRRWRWRRRGCDILHMLRSGAGRVGKEGVSMVRSRWSQCLYKKKQNMITE